MAKTKYLLPCSCGQEIPVEVAQAGQEIHCACGAVLEVPTLQGLKALKPLAPDPATRRKSAWGLRQQLVLLGGVILVVALLLAGVLHWSRPRLRDIDSMTPAELCALWHSLQLGVDYRPPDLQMLDAYLKVHRRWMIVPGTIGLIGLLVMASSLLVPKKRPRRSPPRANHTDPGKGPEPPANAP